MAYAALVSLAQILEQIMHHDHLFYMPLTNDEEQKLNSLQEKVSVLQAFLDDHSHKSGETMQSLQAQIRDAAYKAQDIVECHISDHKISSDCKLGGINCGFWRLISTFGNRGVSQTAIQNEYEEELMKALKQIDSVIDEAMNIQRSSCRVEEIMRVSLVPSLASSSSSSTNDGRNKMVGFDEDLIKIKEVLCEESSRLKVVSIVGMGGIGKTTLARNIFADSYIAYHFHTCAWATVSHGYRLRGILLSILHTLTLKTDLIEEYIRKSYSAETADDKLTEYVYKSLKGKTYLVVMDDMWSTEAWDDVKGIFPDDNNGSRVVITTRLTNVAEYASSSFIHQLHFLDEDQSWILIREKVFVEQTCPPELEEIGKMVAENCGGLPLQLAVIAGVLAKVEKTISSWQNIAEDISLDMANNDEHLSKILSLSYDYLPDHLKPCFLYMGSFLADYTIPISKLIMLWLAEGFLKPVESKSFEEIAEEYLEDLVKRNLVIVTQKKSNGKYGYYDVHDLLRDLCRLKAREEKFLDLLSNVAEIAKDQRRIALDSYNDIEQVDKSTFASSVRSVLYFGNGWDILILLSCLRLLRVLDTPATRLDHFPDEITELFHLRYLAFAYQGENQLRFPPSVYKLGNLQTLIIHALSDYFKPIAHLKIWKIPKLRHLLIFNARFHIPSSPRINGQFHVLENLQTLSTVIDFKLEKETIEMIPNLKKLKVSYTRMSEAKCTELRLNNLVHLRTLESLSLEFVSAPSTLIMRMRGHIYVPFPTSYTLPPNVKQLTLTGCGPPSGDMSIIGSLPNLEVLKLREFYFEEEEWETNEGGFQRLKFLLIELSNLVCWRAENTHFRCLERLIISKCRSLEEIPREIGDITTLELIEVGPCSKSAADSALLIREEQECLGNDVLQVRVYQHEHGLYSRTNKALV
ncbi:hypothetical protein C2S53_013369 [Perilla frutescens var. hirtella]|uniref:NB-ARC domain-containing protein n=1 Tax=Perilla frutescens var. hirtella TaxID=608512 RepID=A0AAD4JHX8_PERFH|nr:hypothetical protein C2S53_013369 [Perilla frutescens var. hirtella]